MSRAASIAGVRPLGWLAHLRAQRSCLAWASAQRSCWAEGAGAARLGPITALGMGARDQHARQRSGARPRVVQTDTFARAQMMATGRGPRAHGSSTCRQAETGPENI